jgi:hypothetical protein
MTRSKYHGTIVHKKYFLHNQTFNSTELHSIILMPQFLNSIPLLPSSYPGRLPSSQSFSTASQETLSINSAGLEFSLHSLGLDPTENIMSVVIAQQYFDCCLRIRCRENLFVKLLPSNECLLWFCYSRFRLSHHNIIVP